MRLTMDAQRLQRILGQLTVEEQRQVKRMLAERTSAVDLHHVHDAIAVVLADRPVQDLACHGGEVETV